MPRHVDRAERERIIVEAALRVFARSGYEATKMTDVAAEAGLGKATLYDTFADKEALFLAVVDRLVAEHLRAVHAELAGAPGRAPERLAAMIRAAAADLERHPAMAPLWLEMWAAASRPGLSAALRAQQRVVLQGFRAVVAEILRAGRQRGEIGDVDPDAMAVAVVAGVEGLLLQRRFDATVDLRAAADALATVIARGL